jgi:hypothetical protein
MSRSTITAAKMIAAPPKPAPLTRLRLHDVVEAERRLWRVSLVNDCRARLTPISKQRREIVPATGKNAGKPVTIESTGDCISISPNSELDIIGRWDPVREQVILARSPDAHSVLLPGSKQPEASLPPADPEPVSTPEPAIIHQQELL